MAKQDHEESKAGQKEAPNQTTEAPPPAALRRGRAGKFFVRVRHPSLKGTQYLGPFDPVCGMRQQRDMETKLAAGGYCVDLVEGLKSVPQMALLAAPNQNALLKGSHG